MSLTKNQFSLLDSSSTMVISVLNAGLAGLGSVSVNASKRGLSIKLDGATLARGKTPKELNESFAAAREAAAAKQQTTAN